MTADLLLDSPREVKVVERLHEKLRNEILLQYFRALLL